MKHLVVVSSGFNTKHFVIFSNGEFETILELPEGDHEFKYLVDGKWVHDPNLVSFSLVNFLHDSII